MLPEGLVISHVQFVNVEYASTSPDIFACDLHIYNIQVSLLFVEIQVNLQMFFDLSEQKNTILVLDPLISQLQKICG